MKTILRESMTALTFGDFKVRVWRQEEPDGTPSNGDLTAELQKAVMTLDPDNRTPKRIAEWLIALDRVNAVEVLYPDGTGEVLYADWP